MVSRRKLVVVDLDGTLIAGNSLHIYLKCGAAELLRTGNIISALKVLGLGALRVLRIISHRRMKFAAIAMIERTEHLRQVFCAKIDSIRRPEVEMLINEFRAADCDVILATAAADVYVDWIWQGVSLATPIEGNSNRVELRGSTKRDAVLQYMQQHNAQLHAVVTDHADDLALLMCGARQNILVHPSSSAIAAAQMAGVANLRIIA
jgi:phosphoserine phosphatase